MSIISFACMLWKNIFNSNQKSTITSAHYPEDYQVGTSYSTIQLAILM